MTLRKSLPLLLLLAPAMGWSVHLRVHGQVNDLITGEGLAGALVRVYKDGEVQHRLHTGANGSYSIRLENNGHYVLRFSLPGHVTKCFAVSTHGPAWQGDNRTAELEVGILLFPPVDGLDLGLFDLPLGLARFQPMTGLIGWNGEYEGRVRPEAFRLMDRVRQHHLGEALAQRGGMVGRAY